MILVVLATNGLWCIRVGKALIIPGGIETSLEVPPVATQRLTVSKDGWKQCCATCEMTLLRYL